MAFTPEDGSGVTGANAYIDVAFADTYHLDRGFTAWEKCAPGIDVTQAQKQAAIIRATDHVDRVYGEIFVGWKGTKAQGLQWPRTSAWDYNDFKLDGVPEALANAVAEYALRAVLQGVLTPDPAPNNPQQTLESGAETAVFGQASGEVIKTVEKVGPIVEEKEYARSSSSTSGSGSSVNRGPLENFPAADMLLRPILRAKRRMLIRG